MSRFFTIGADLLPLLLDLPAEETMTSIDIVNDVVTVNLAGDGGEVVAEYRVDVAGHRHFSGFRAPDAAADVEAPSATPPPEAPRVIPPESPPAAPVPVADEDTTTSEAEAEAPKGSA